LINAFFFFQFPGLQGWKQELGMEKHGASNGSWQNVSTSFFCFIGGVESNLRQRTRIKHFGTFCHCPLQNNKLI
jgi:hypothetical protein